MKPVGAGDIVLLTFATPLPIALLAELCKAIGDGAERAGYTDVALLTDGSMRVVARRPEAVAS